MLKQYERARQRFDTLSADYWSRVYLRICGEIDAQKGSDDDNIQS